MSSRLDITDQRPPERRGGQLCLLAEFLLNVKLAGFDHEADVRHRQRKGLEDGDPDEPLATLETAHEGPTDPTPAGLRLAQSTRLAELPDADAYVRTGERRMLAGARHAHRFVSLIPSLHLACVVIACTASEHC
jgi:hypothetical protein